MELKVEDRVRVKETFNFDIKKFKKGLKGTVLENNGDIFCIEFDTYINGHNGGDIFGSSGKDGYCWNFDIEEQKCFEIIKEKEMKKEDIILKRGDVVTYKDGHKESIDCWDGWKGIDNVTPLTNIVKVERPTGYKTIYEAPKEILDKEEKEYLEGVIRPFRDRVGHIKICSNARGYFITIALNTDDAICLPYFEEDTMYKGMEADRNYTLKELGLFEGE